MNPTVACICLTRERPKLLLQAVECFRRQTYTYRWLLIYDTSAELPEPIAERHIIHVWRPASAGQTIGALRNEANRFAAGSDAKPDILIHWDDDDWSHPNRIAEQVALLQTSGKECVGYREMLFCLDSPGQFCGAWLYMNRDPRYCLGTSLCYWRKTWENRPFADLPKARGGTGEDTMWLREVNSLGAHSVVRAWAQWVPRMIARIHGNNSQDYSRFSEQNWRRVPEWDERVRNILEGKWSAAPR